MRKLIIITIPLLYLFAYQSISAQKTGKDPKSAVTVDSKSKKQLADPEKGKSEKPSDNVDQAKPSKKPAWNPDDDDAKKAEEILKKSSSVDPAFGVMGLMTFPLGELSPIFGYGFGAKVFADFRMPFIKSEIFEVRLGVTGEFFMLSSSLVDLTFIPILGYAGVLFPITDKIAPYVHLGGGITYVSSVYQGTGEAIESSVDATAYVAAGVYISLTPAIRINIGGGYNFQFETLNGQFLNIHLGVSYRIRN